MQGWGGLGEGLAEVAEGVMLLETAVPHDWLFKHCSAVVHHGGAGPTAAGLKAGGLLLKARSCRMETVQGKAGLVSWKKCSPCAMVG